MKKLFQLTNQYFESSCSRTPQYLAWHRTFKREFGNFLGEMGCADIRFSKPNHFDGSGFFSAPNGKIFYFSVSDLRWFKDKMLIRTAQNYSDFTGGPNQYATLSNEEDFRNQFKRIIQ